MTNDERHELVPPVRKDRDHIRGEPDAAVQLVEYGDFECPFCGRAHSVIEQIERDLGRSLSFVFRHFPLATMHPHALRAALAAEAAAEQGAFWPMHDALFENQEALEDEDLVRYAADIGIDVDRFVDSLAAAKHEGRVREDFRSGARSGVNGTPTFFIDGVRYDGSWDYEPLLEALQSRIAKRRAA